MAATVTIRRWTGSAGGPTKNDITSINTRANAEDTHTTAGTSNPTLVPPSGTNYSYWVSTRLSVDVAPTTGINNIKWYTDGANGFGTGITCKVSNGTSTYTQATGTPGQTGTQLDNTNYPGSGTPTDAFTYTSGSPLSVTGSIGATTGDLGNFVVYQIEVASTAGPGPTNQETFTWQFDET